MPSQPRKPSVRPPELYFFSFQSATNFFATSGFLTASGNQGVKNTVCIEPLAAAPACSISWSGDVEPPVVMMRVLSCRSFACLRISVTCSTAVVTNSVSAPDALILASCAEKSVALGSIVSTTPTVTPSFFAVSAKACEAPMPKSLLVARKSAFLIPSFLKNGPKARASISDVGLIRNTYGLPEVVILPDDDVSTSIGTLYSSSLGITASVSVELHAPIITGTLSLLISFSAVATASVGFDLLSSTTSWIFLPRTPPDLLISSSARRAPCVT